jgi:hypothetical protein
MSSGGGGGGWGMNDSIKASLKRGRKDQFTRMNMMTALEM